MRRPDLPRPRILSQASGISSGLGTARANRKVPSNQSRRKIHGVPGCVVSPEGHARYMSSSLR